MKKKFSLIKEYQECWKYIQESKNFIYLAFGVFFIFVLVGFFVPAPESIKEQILIIIEKILETTIDLSTSELITFIFFNNIQSSFLGMILGILVGVYPLMALIFNGYLLGFVASMSYDIEGFSILWKILPHGIFELPAIFISLGLGIRLGTIFFQKNKKDSFRKLYLISLKVFFYIVLPLLIIAAVIEGSLIYAFQ
ncbi:MAG: stage II sporulation protein M [Nanoarchaeota archaeon]|nr:stage II sporulation protein M [Nanoarchaeota archaeon]